MLVLNRASYRAQAGTLIILCRTRPPILAIDSAHGRNKCVEIPAFIALRRDQDSPVINRNEIQNLELMLEDFKKVGNQPNWLIAPFDLILGEVRRGVNRSRIQRLQWFE